MNRFDGTVTLFDAPLVGEVKHLHNDRERHRNVDECLVDLDTEPVRDEYNSDEHEECESKHLDRWVSVDERKDVLGREEHDPERKQDCHVNDEKVVNHPDRGYYRVKGKDDVDEHDLHDHPSEGHCTSACPTAMGLRSLEFFVNLAHRFVDEESAAEDQNEVAPREAEVGDDEQVFLQVR